MLLWIQTKNFLILLSRFEFEDLSTATIGNGKNYFDNSYTQEYYGNKHPKRQRLNISYFDISYLP